MARSLIVDTDTGSDDAVALLMAARLPGVALRAVTTVAGNVPAPQPTPPSWTTTDEPCDHRRPLTWRPWPICASR